MTGEQRQWRVGVHSLVEKSPFSYAHGDAQTETNEHEIGATYGGSARNSLVHVNRTCLKYQILTARCSRVPNRSWQPAAPVLRASGSSSTTNYKDLFFLLVSTTPKQIQELALSR